MKKIKRVLLLVIIMLDTLIVGCGSIVLNDKSVLEDNDMGRMGIFTDDIYDKSDKNGIIVVKRKEDITEEQKEQLYGISDIENLNNKIVDSQNEMTFVVRRENRYIYLEDSLPKPTGASIEYVCDEDGYIEKVYYTTVDGFKNKYGDTITTSEAFEIGYAEMMKKYGEDTYFDDGVLSGFHNWEWFYEPSSGRICYSFDAIKGHIPEYDGSIVDPISFYITVSLDGEFVQIASSLRR